MLSDHVPEPATKVADAGERVVDAAELVVHAGCSLLVLGPAGSGKTRLLIDRFSWHVRQGTPPERMAVLLPTAARADAIRAALEQRLDGGYSELLVLTAPQLAAAVLRRFPGGWHERPEITLTQGDRLAMLAERIGELSLRHHDYGGNAGALLGSFVRRIDRLKAELIDAGRFGEWAQQHGGSREREFAEIFQAHEQMVRELGAGDDNDLIRLAIGLAEDHAPVRLPFAQLLLDETAVRHFQLDALWALILMTSEALIQVAGPHH